MDELDDFVATCQSLLGEANAEERVAEAMRPLLAEPSVLGPLIEDLRSVPGEAAVVHRSDELTVLGLEIAAGFVSPPHNHTLWAVAGIYEGAEDNVFYRRSEDGIEETGEAVLAEGECLALPADAVHQIANTGSGPMRALHAYGGDLFATSRSQWDLDSGQELPFGSTG